MTDIDPVPPPEIYEAEHADPIPARGGEGEAAWHLRQAMRYRDQAKIETEATKATIADLKAQLDERTQMLDERARWHERAVEAWHRAHLANGRLTQTVHLAGAVSQLRRRPAELHIDDEDLLRAEMAAHHDPETGASWESEIWRRTEKFLISELRSRLDIGATNRLEPGAAVTVTNPETGAPVKGLRAIYTGMGWSGSHG